MNKIIPLLLLSVLIAFNSGYAQKKKITGTIRAEGTQAVLQGVSVLVKGTGKGTYSDENGSFIISINTANDSTLVFSFIGYETKEAAIGSGSRLDLSLIPTRSSLREVEIVGSRNVHRTKENSLAPVDIIDVRTLLQSAPQVTVTEILHYVAPSFHSSTGGYGGGGDAASATSLAQLRGLGVDQLLVLVNGKRRHKSSNINFGGNGNGTTGYDLNAIPTGSIERIEILRDGAAAQYGSDAIAGVVNIVLRKTVNDLLLGSAAGARYAGDGVYTNTYANYGFKAGNNGGYLNATLEYRTQGLSRPGKGDAGLYTGVIYGGGAGSRGYDAIYTEEIDNQILKERGLTRKNFDQRGGIPKQQDALLEFNGAFPVGSDGEFYVFGGIGHRNSEFTGIYRLPGQGTRGNTLIYPDGFLPEMQNGITDQYLTSGIRSRYRNWNVDFSNSFGRNAFSNKITNSINASYGLKSPKTFDAGRYSAAQNNTTLDLSRYFDHVLSGLNIAFGAQYRIETYVIVPGEQASYDKGDLRRIYRVDTINGVPYIDNTAGIIALNGTGAGSQIHLGFTPESATNVSRSVVAAYVDIEANITRSWTVSGAVRTETSSDFGNVITGKVASRLTLTPWLNLRGSFSSGFRAPDLAQFYYTSTSSGIVNGLWVDALTASNQSAAARALGIPRLTPEKSKNISVGFNARLSGNWNFAVDAFNIDINNRVASTGNFSVDDPGIPDDLKTAFAASGANQANFFLNAFNTRTSGIEITSDQHFRIGKGKINFIAAGSFYKNEVKKIVAPPGLENFKDIILNKGEIDRVERQTPQQKFTLQAVYSTGRFNFLAREVYFGKVRGSFAFAGYYFYQDYNPLWVTDLSVSYKISQRIQATAGVNNLLNDFGGDDLPLFRGGRLPSPSGYQNGGRGGQGFIAVTAHL